MRELKTLLIVIFCVAFLYYGVEPFAHTKLHPHVANADYDFEKEDLTLALSDIKAAENGLKVAKKNLANAEKANIKSNNAETKSNLEKAKTAVDGAQKVINEKKAFEDKYTLFWDEVSKINLSVGDPVKGAETIINAGCTGCHGIKAAGFEAPMDAVASTEAYGVNPPDLSLAGKIYDEKFLVALIKDPAMALKVTHKFNDEKPFPMPQFFGAGGDINQEIADMVAYLKSIVPADEVLIAEQREKKGIKSDVVLNDTQKSFLLNRAVFESACVRCHGMKYDKISAEGNANLVAAYMGSTPPDLSMMIRSKSKEYLHNFINDTQKLLPGTAMPRVGLNKTSEDQVIAYLESVGDSKKSQRESVAIKIMIFFLIMSVFAYLWKNSIWRNLH